MNHPERIIGTLAAELQVDARSIAAAVALLDGGATVPFIARYRKEATGGLDDTVLRNLETRLAYLRELEARRDAILASVKDQGKLSEELRQALEEADTKQRLEDLYAPYRPKRRTRAQIAREAGLQPLLEAILAQAGSDPAALAQAYVRPESGVETVKAALDGARDILAEDLSEDAALIGGLREWLWGTGLLCSVVVPGKEAAAGNFRDWFDFHEALPGLPSHRVLALLRGRQQGLLELRVGLSEEQEALTPHPATRKIAEFLDRRIDFGTAATPWARWLADACRWAWRVRILPAFENEFLARLRENAEREAIRVFAANLKDLLLAPPAGPKPVMGLDPGIRTGVKVAVIDPTGKLLETATVYPFEPRRDREGTLQVLARLCRTHQVALAAIGNGTASRETEKLVAELQDRHPELQLKRMVVSEAGASIYSASELAALEFPDLDVSLRGAVSIARRLQDPLAELVKIDPKSIGVGQYQHDVNQRDLAQSLETVIEDCVNAVGVDVNTASVPLLGHVSGVGPVLARNIVAWRNEHGPFENRSGLLAVPRFGPKSFELAAGFLRIPGGSNPLDASAVHPEAYPVVERILGRIKAGVRDVMGRPGALKGLSPGDFTDERFGVPTVRDIFQELERPGRDPRPEFATASFAEGVHDLGDLHVGMVIEGVVTNVANFGAFVDIGVHQDGLVHVSALADRYVKDPREVVRVGQHVKVKVLEVDQDRKRIALSMRLKDDAPPARPAASARAKRGKARQAVGKPEAPMGAMAAAFQRLKN